jgi:hypothetical protein
MNAEESLSLTPPQIAQKTDRKFTAGEVQIPE